MESHLISEDSESLLECQLKPIPHGHSVATPVMEVLMANHTQNPLEVGVSGCGGIRQHIRRVEYIQTLILPDNVDIYTRY